MKKLFICCFLLLLLAGCGNGETDPAVKVDELPDSAERVFAYSYSGDFSENSGEYGEHGEGIAHGSWSVSGEGYFILEVDYHSGAIKNLSIRMNNPDNRIFCTFPDADVNGMYRTGSSGFSQDSDYVLWFGKADGLKATYTVYFVEE